MLSTKPSRNWADSIWPTIARAIRAFAPPPTLTVSQWADQHRRLSPESSAEHGQWVTARAEYQRGMMDAISDPRVEVVVLKTSSQIGKTEILNNALGYYIVQDPSPTLIVQPTIEIGEAWSKDRLAPMLRDTPVLHGKVKDYRAKDSANTIMHKALAIDTPIPTPAGWTTMGDIRVGDTVFGPHGHQCSVTHVTPVIRGRPCYRITFSDGATIIADEEHLWPVERWLVRAGKLTRHLEVVTTAQLRAKTGRPYASRVAQPLDLPDADLPVHPYVLGAWLGDGYSHRSAICAGPQDEEMGELLAKCGVPIRRQVISRRCCCSILIRRADEGHTAQEDTRWAITGRRPDGHCAECHRHHARRRRTGQSIDPPMPTTIRAKLQTLGLLKRIGQGPTKKSIPAVYLRASMAQRLALLQGLMDTDGYVSKSDGRCVFATSIPILADQVGELIASLGIKYVRYAGAPRRGSKFWRLEFIPNIAFPVFRLTRKLARLSCQTKPTTDRQCRRIRRIESVDSVPVRCIAVDSPDHLYLAGKAFIPTHNTFPGGHLTIAGSNSPASLRARPIRIVKCDDIDAFKPTVEGDAVDLARKRTTTFWNRKIILASTPTIKGQSRIEKAFDESDQRYFYVPCPCCATFDRLYWANVKWEKDDPTEVWYQCETCGAKLTDQDRLRMVKAGEWRATKPFTGTAGFFIFELYSPWVSMRVMVASFLAAKKNPETLRVWVNTSLGETWTEDEDPVDKDSILGRRETYPAPVPAGALVLTCAVDVQLDRLEAEVYGWGIGDESWSIERAVFHGSPVNEAVWTELTQWRTKTWTHESGIGMRIEKCVVDTGDGKHTREAYKYVRKHWREGVCAIKGSSEPRAPLMAGMSYNKLGKVKLYSVGTNAAKDTLFARLKLEEYGPGYIHHPISETHDEEYFAQLTAESRVPKYDRGVLVGHTYKKTRTRNETLDLAVYNLFAHALRNPQYEAIAKKLAAQAAEQTAPAERPDDPPTPVPPKPPPFVPRHPGRGWVSGWRGR